MSRNLGDEEDDNDEEIRGSLKIEISSARSRLSKTLSEIVADKEALGYFIQFMDSRGKLGLIKFWMEVECVREASSENTEFINDCNQSDNNDNCFLEERLNGVELVNSNLRENFNENPKTRLCNWRSISEEPGELSSIFQDALRIHKKYIFKDNLRVNEINLALKNNMEEAVRNEDASRLIKYLLMAQKIAYKILETE